MKKLFQWLGAWVGDLSPTCKQATRLQSQALDGELPWRQRLGLRIHLCLCRWCSRYGKQLGFMRKALHKSEAKDSQGTPAKLPPEARERIAKSLRGGLK